VTRIVIFADNNPESTEDDRVGTVTFRQMSYFADEDGIDGLLQYLGEDVVNVNAPSVRMSLVCGCHFSCCCGNHGYLPFLLLHATTACLDITSTILMRTLATFTT
jgi:hypothetical protein